jgi:RecB family endonuclease NucS
LKHKSLVNYFSTNPYKIEPRFRTLQKEFSLGHGRIDIIGKDRNGNICLVEVKTRDSEIPLGKRQLRKYQSKLANFLRLIHVETVIRGIVVTPTKVIDVETIKSFVPQPRIKVPLDIPTSREIFGLKTDMKIVTPRKLKRSLKS